MREFRPRELQDYLTQAAQPPLLLDVREPWEFNICHLQDSELLPMGQIPSAWQKMDRQRETVVICHHGVRSRQVAFFLEQMGFNNMINLTGGVNAWAREVEPTMAVY